MDVWMSFEQAGIADELVIAIDEVGVIAQGEFDLRLVYLLEMLKLVEETNLQVLLLGATIPKSLLSLEFTWEKFRMEPPFISFHTDLPLIKHLRAKHKNTKRRLQPKHFYTHRTEISTSKGTVRSQVSLHPRLVFSTGDMDSRPSVASDSAIPRKLTRSPQYFSETQIQTRSS